MSSQSSVSSGAPRDFLEKPRNSSSLLNFLVILQVFLSLSLALPSLIGVGVEIYESAEGFFAFAIAQFVGSLPGLGYMFNDHYVLLVDYVAFQIVVTASEAMWGVIGLFMNGNLIALIVVLLCLPLNVCGVVIGAFYFDNELPQWMRRFKLLATLARRRNHVFVDKARSGGVSGTRKDDAESGCFQVSSLGAESRMNSISTSDTKVCSSTSKSMEQNAERRENSILSTLTNPIEKEAPEKPIVSSGNEGEKQLPLISKKVVKQLAKETNTSF
ncbi:hypothetical protein QR680_005150 [Steinernema hermaphroditum]|uniref:Uncharacterized protein n=1 Tax=Steinernema hermaphroditum TaxID=289476 RepID=A0AA39LV54_9BILA|nr:hypothetical protein QR680_005150 [Steinernema hermaphroditum]